MSNNFTGFFLTVIGIVLCSCSENANPLVKLNKAIEEETRNQERQKQTSDLSSNTGPREVGKPLPPQPSDRNSAIPDIDRVATEETKGRDDVIPDIFNACFRGDLEEIVKLCPEYYQPILNEVESLPKSLRSEKYNVLVDDLVNELKLESAYIYDDRRDSPESFIVGELAHVMMSFLAARPDWTVEESRKIMVNTYIPSATQFARPRSAIEYFVKLKYSSVRAPFRKIGKNYGPLREAMISLKVDEESGGVVGFDGLPSSYKSHENQKPRIIAARLRRGGDGITQLYVHHKYYIDIFCMGRVAESAFHVYLDGSPVRCNAKYPPGAIYEDGFTTCELVMEEFVPPPRMIRIEIRDSSGITKDSFEISINPPEIDGNRAYTRLEYADYGLCYTFVNIARNRLGPFWTGYTPAITPFCEPYLSESGRGSLPDPTRRQAEMLRFLKVAREESQKFAKGGPSELFEGTWLVIHQDGLYITFHESGRSTYKYKDGRKGEEKWRLNDGVLNIEGGGNNTNWIIKEFTLERIILENASNGGEGHMVKVYDQ